MPFRDTVAHPPIDSTALHRTSGQPSVMASVRCPPGTSTLARPARATSISGAKRARPLRGLCRAVGGSLPGLGHCRGAWLATWPAPGQARLPARPAQGGGDQLEAEADARWSLGPPQAHPPWSGLARAAASPEDVARGRLPPRAGPRRGGGEACGLARPWHVAYGSRGRGAGGPPGGASPSAQAASTPNHLPRALPPPAAAPPLRPRLRHRILLHAGGEPQGCHRGLFVPLPPGESGSLTCVALPDVQHSQPVHAHLAARRPSLGASALGGGRVSMLREGLQGWPHLRPDDERRAYLPQASYGLCHCRRLTTGQ